MKKEIPAEKILDAGTVPPIKPGLPVPACSFLKQWLGILHKTGKYSIILSKDWKRAQQRPGVREVFGPFEAKDIKDAKLKLRGIAAAVGFGVGNDL